MHAANAAFIYTYANSKGISDFCPSLLLCFVSHELDPNPDKTLHGKYGNYLLYQLPNEQETRRINPCELFHPIFDLIFFS
jgi:hypothetical protein